MRRFKTTQSTVELLQRPLPRDLDTERETIAALIVGHWCVEWAYFEELTVEDFYLGQTDLHGWMFHQMQWAFKKRQEPVSEIVKFKAHSPNGDVTAYLKELLEWSSSKIHLGSVKKLPRYIDVLHEVRGWRSKIIAAQKEIKAAEKCYREVWSEYDDTCL